MTIKSCTLEEQERVEEEELSNNFHNLNLSFKERDTDEFINSLTHLSKNSNFDFFPKCTKAVETFRPFSLNSIDNFSIEKLSNASTNDCGDEMVMQSFFLQNLEIFEDVLKVMVLGDKCSGKSLLISKLLNKGKSNYIPTTILEINNKIVKLLGKFVKIEFFDTSANILRDSLIKSKYRSKVSLL
jgi:polynucleotide 5'-kinase involved in rRNA processing